MIRSGGSRRDGATWAMTAERQCRQRGEILDVPAHAFLARLRHAPAISEARANLARLGESVEKAVQAAVMKHGKEE